MSVAAKPIVDLPRLGRREQRKHVTRRELLAAGRRLFGEHGLYESSIEDLSRDAGIAKGTLYGYFRNKVELIEAVVGSGLNDLLAQVHRQAAGARTPAERVARVAEAHLKFFDDNPDWMRIFHQVRGLMLFRRPEGLALRRVLTRYLVALGDVLAQRPAASNGVAGDRLEQATLLFGAIAGIVSTSAALAGPERGRRAPRARVNALVALVLALSPESL
jgi:AcrR family transcriptional regulator